MIEQHRGIFRPTLATASLYLEINSAESGLVRWMLMVKGGTYSAPSLLSSLPSSDSSFLDFGSVADGAKAVAALPLKKEENIDMGCVSRAKIAISSFKPIANPRSPDPQTPRSPDWPSHSRQPFIVSSRIVHFPHPTSETCHNEQAPEAPGSRGS